MRCRKFNRGLQLSNVRRLKLDFLDVHQIELGVHKIEASTEKLEFSPENPAEAILFFRLFDLVTDFST